MILTPTNNSAPLPLNQSGAQSSAVSKPSNVSSPDLASSSQIPSVNVSLLASSSLAASSIPPIYSKPTVASSNELQLSPSRPNASSAGLAENAILSGSSEAKKAEGSGVGESNRSDDGAEKVKPKTGQESTESNSSGVKLSENELKLVEELKLRDREVKAHEQAHKAVGGQYAGAISYSYQAGPDGKRYAVGGEVPIDVSPIAGDPQATISKMTIVRAAANAPAEPSAQDRAVAAQASALLAEAQADLVKSRSEPEKQSSSGQVSDEEDRETATSGNSIGVFISVSQNGETSNNLINASV